MKTWLPSLPFPRNEDREEIITERLVIRPWKLDDVPAVHAIRTQPEVMMWTSQARPDANMAETEAKVKLFTSPNDAGNFNFVICDKATGEMIGMGGNHRRESDVGYVLLFFLYFFFFFFLSYLIPPSQAPSRSSHMQYTMPSLFCGGGGIGLLMCCADFDNNATQLARARLHSAKGILGPRARDRISPGLPRGLSQAPSVASRAAGGGDVDSAVPGRWRHG